MTRHTRLALTMRSPVRSRRRLKTHKLYRRASLAAMTDDDRRRRAIEQRAGRAPRSALDRLFLHFRPPGE